MKFGAKFALFSYSFFFLFSLILFSQDKPTPFPTSVQLVRIEITFQNGQYYQIVKKGEQAPRIRCQILAQGQGVIDGFWSINEQMVLPVHLTIDGFKNIHLTSQQVPHLPAQDSGVHSVSFQFTTPVVNTSLPVLRYFVSTEAPLKALLPLPAQTFILGDDVALEWSRVKGEYQYQLAISQIPFQFLKDEQIDWMEPITESQFSLMTKPMTGGYVYWLVRATSSTGRIVSASTINSFLLKEKMPQVPDEEKK